MTDDDTQPALDAASRWVERADELVERALQGEQINESALQHAPEEVREKIAAVLRDLELFRRRGGSEVVDSLCVNVIDPGSMLGRYRILVRLGSGAQGTVYRAEDGDRGGLVAIKVFPIRGVEAKSRLRRFQREAESLIDLHDPVFCTVFDVGSDDHRAWIAMRLIDGESLAVKLARNEAEVSPAASGPSRIREAVKLVRKVAEAIHRAHERGIVNRDIKPANIMVKPDGEPVVLDLGLAGATRPETSLLTRTGDQVGTPAYMAPEQIHGDGSKIDRQTDVWALGVVLYECLTGRRPFDGGTRDAIFRAILQDEPLDARKLNARVTRDLTLVVATALQKQKVRRYHSAIALAQDLARVGAGEAVQARAPSIMRRACALAARHQVAATCVVMLVLALAVVVAATLGSWHAGIVTATDAWRAGRLDAARDAVAPVPRAYLRLARSGPLTEFAARIGNDQDPLALAAGALRRGEPMQAMLSAATPLREGGPRADILARTFLEGCVSNALDDPAGYRSPFRRDQVLSVLARLFSERQPENGDEEAEWTRVLAGIRSLWRQATEGSAGREQILLILSCFYGLGHIDDALEIMGWLARRGARASEEERRLGLWAAAAIIMRSNRLRTLSGEQALVLRDRLATIDRSIEGALDRKAMADLLEPVARALLLAERRLSLPETALQDLPACLGLSPSPTKQQASHWIHLLCAAKREALMPLMMETLKDMITQRCNLKACGRYCALLGLRDWQSRVDIGRLECGEDMREFKIGWELGEKEVEGLDLDQAPHRDSLLRAWSACDLRPLEVSIAGLPPAGRSIAKWKFRNGKAEVAGVGVSVKVAGGALESDGPSRDGREVRFLRLFRSGESQVEFSFRCSNRIGPTEAPILVVCQEKGVRSFQPYGGTALISLHVDGVRVLSDTVLGNRTSPTSYRLPPWLLSEGDHRIAIRVNQDSTTTYRLYEVELKLMQ